MLTLLLVLGGIAGLVIALLAGVIVACMKAPRITLLVATGTVLALSAAWTAFVHAHRLSFLPDALQVKQVLYANEASWGFGPSGNEAGFLAYRLPDEAATAISTSGQAWLETMPPQPARKRWRGSFSQWQPTPVQAGPHWQPDQDSGRFEVLQYVCAYGFCIDIDARWLREADEALNLPGSFYAYGRIGMIVVSPRQRRVFYLYNG